jgi:alkanesulfonate monooxygenase SsuD/methylene tetrahydromethanopterin reductase-like flavin-dependent oxidoreductase (luciferase family)/predicted kinase
VIALPEPALVFLIGASGSGKSTWAAARYLPNEVVSSDRLRAVVGSSEYDLDASGDAFALLNRIVELRLGRRLTTVVDTTGLDAALRAACIERAGEAGIPAVAVLFETPERLCRARNRERPRPVPAKVLSSQLARVRKLGGTLDSEGWFQVVRVGSAADETIPEQRVVPAVAEKVGISFVLHLARFDWPGGADEMSDRMAAVAGAAELAGFSGISLMDHLVQIPQVGRVWEPIPEVFTGLAHLASRTTRLEVGPLVLNMALRNPALVAKMMATLDVLSGGRTFCGVGAGWNVSEEAMYGYPPVSTARRLDLLEEGIEVLQSMWGAGKATFAGSTIAVTGAVSYPRPARGDIPIVVGGGGERRTLRIAARLADAVNVQGEPAVIARKRAVLDGHCRDLGRDPAELDLTVLDVTLVGTDRSMVSELVDRHRGRLGPHAYARRTNAGTIPEQAARYRELAKAGVDTVFVALPDLEGPEQVERFGEIVSAVR